MHQHQPKHPTRKPEPNVDSSNPGPNVNVRYKQCNTLVKGEHNKKHTQCNHQNHIRHSTNQQCNINKAGRNYCIKSGNISPKVKVARYTSTWWQPYGLHKKQLTHKIRLVAAKVSHREHALAYPNHSFKTCGSPKA